LRTAFGPILRLTAAISQPNIAAQADQRDVDVSGLIVRDDAVE
jgi:hypothetical protein